MNDKRLSGVNLRFIRSNGIRMRVAEAGPSSGPCILLAHGWPESWFSWRYQIGVLASEGYRVLVPDMRGFGSTDAPQEVASYNVLNLVEDMVGILDAADCKTATIVGHDWGAVVAWHCAMVHPQRFPGVVAMSVPHFGRPHDAPTRVWKKRHGDDFYYILYHQKPGVAESEYEHDPEALLAMLYASPDTPRDPPTIPGKGKDAGGFIGRWGAPKALPSWLSKSDLDFYVGEFRRAGFRGGLNYYRNFDLNWELTVNLDQVVRVPALFIAGTLDLTIAHLPREEVERRMQAVVPGLRNCVWMESAGHWVQQERSAECTAALLSFFRNL